MRESDGLLLPYIEGATTVTRRQDQELLLARNGPAVLIVSSATLRAGKLYGKRTLGYRMSLRDSIDVDTPDDLRTAEMMLSLEGSRGGAR